MYHDLSCTQSKFNSITIPSDGTLNCNGTMETKNIQISSGGSFNCHEDVNFLINGKLQYGSIEPISTIATTYFPNIDVSNLDVSYIKVHPELSANTIICDNLNTTSFQFDGDLLISNLTIKIQLRLM